MYHIISYKEADDVLFFHDISAVALAEAAEHSGMTGGIIFFGEEAAVMAEFIHDDIFLCPEQGIEGLTGDLSLAAQITDADLVEGYFFKKSQQSF